MSGLAAVLAGRHAPGVHRWDSALDVVDVEHAVEHAGWAFGYVDGAGLEELPAVLDAIGRALVLPEHYGRNLDALNDCLRDLGTPTVLLWDAWGGFAHADPRRFAVLVEVLGSRADDDPAVEVLLRGPGPADVVPLLD
ncbi:RNAse (barnase) inhibitor barstar [Nocardioides sp. J9]|uniref:barstar family protein n=1 Tax=unclassified Nocardioides TaxID=2615069 RepID=UPI0004ADAF3D|nr:MULTISPECIES: barstar family protein [unclassified Nocardioides]TWH01329.1 RNAse (barnase) inhibitor barstar [Nocardioides sp. J9]